MAKTQHAETPAQEPATETARGPGRPAKEKPAFKRKAALQLPTYSIADWPQGKPLFVRIEGEMQTREQTNKDGSVKMDEGKPLHITTVPITDLETGEQGSMVVPFIIKKGFDAVVERDGSLAGHAFELIKGRKVNRTNEYSVFEIETE